MGRFILIPVFLCSVLWIITEGTVFRDRQMIHRTPSRRDKAMALRSRFGLHIDRRPSREDRLRALRMVLEEKRRILDERRRADAKIKAVLEENQRLRQELFLRKQREPKFKTNIAATLTEELASKRPTKEKVVTVSTVSKAPMSNVENVTATSPIMHLHTAMGTENVTTASPSVSHTPQSTDPVVTSVVESSSKGPASSKTLTTAVNHSSPTSTNAFKDSSVQSGQGGGSKVFPVTDTIEARKDSNEELSEQNNGSGVNLTTTRTVPMTASMNDTVNISDGSIEHPHLIVPMKKIEIPREPTSTVSAPMSPDSAHENETNEPTTNVSGTKEPSETGGTANVSETKGKTVNESGTNGPTTNVSGTKSQTDNISETKGPTTNVSETKGPTTNVSGTKGPTSNVSGTKGPTTNVSETKGLTTNASGTQVPATNVSGNKGPTTNVSGTKGPTTNVSGTKGLTTNVSETEGPTTNASGTKVPATNVSGNKGPTTNVSGTEGPTTNVSETKGPTTNVPATKGPIPNVHSTSVRPPGLSSETRDGTQTTEQLATGQTTRKFPSTASTTLDPWNDSDFFGPLGVAAVFEDVVFPSDTANLVPETTNSVPREGAGPRVGGSRQREQPALSGFDVVSGFLSDINSWFSSRRRPNPSTLEPL